MNKTIISLLLIASLALLAQAKIFNHRKVVWAVDCGNPQGYKSASGFYYQPVIMS